MRLLHCADRDEWLSERRNGLGASDAPVILGLSAWKSPMQLYAEKAGLLEVPVEERDELEWGHRLEPAIAAKYEDETGRQTFDPGPFTIQLSTDTPWLMATIDRIAGVAGSGASRLVKAWPPMQGPGVLELKNAIEYKRDQWEDEPPLLYQVQVQHQLAVTGYQWGSIAVLIGGRSFLWTDVRRNEPFIARLLDAEAQFWERVQRRIPPEPDASAATTAVLSKLYPKEEYASMEPAPAEALAWDEQLQEAKLHLKRWKGVEDEMENKLKAVIGAAAGVVLPNGQASYTWKWQQRAGYTVAPTEFRVLRRKGATKR